MAVSFIGGGNRSTQRKPQTCRKSPTNFFTQCCIEYTSPWTEFKLTTVVVIGIGCTGSWKSRPWWLLCNFDIFFFDLSDIITINKMMLILKNMSVWRQAHDVTDEICKIVRSSVILLLPLFWRSQLYIITCISAHSIRLAAILMIMSVSTFKTTVILHIIMTQHNVIFLFYNWNVENGVIHTHSTLFNKKYPQIYIIWRWGGLCLRPTRLVGFL